MIYKDFLLCICIRRGGGAVSWLKNEDQRAARSPAGWREPGNSDVCVNGCACPMTYFFLCVILFYMIFILLDRVTYGNFHTNILNVLWAYPPYALSHTQPFHLSYLFPWMYWLLFISSVQVWLMSVNTRTYKWRWNICLPEMYLIDLTG